MKYISNLLVLFLFVLTACDDPYENDNYSPYDVSPAATYLSSRSETFSEWIHILKYADLYNAVNQATQQFTLFVPDNAAVKQFYTEHSVNSIEEMGSVYARNLVMYHVVNDSITFDEFSLGGRLEKKTLSDDYLTVTYGDGGANTLYLNDVALVTERANKVSNGYVYVLDRVLPPLVETAYQRIEQYEKPCTIFKEALETTSWKDSLNVIADTIISSSGYKQVYKRAYTVLGVTDEVFKMANITNLDDLKTKLGAGSDYANPYNALNKYVAYHILEGTLYVQDLDDFEVGTNKRLLDCKAPDEVVQVSKEGNVLYFNYEDGAGIAIEDQDIVAKNGIIHFVNDYMPEWTPEPTVVTFDVCNYPEVRNRIDTKPDMEGQKYQTSHSNDEYRTSVVDLLPPYTVQKSPSGNGAPLSTYGWLDYFTAKASSAWNDAKFHDLLILNVGYMGSVEMKTPTVIQGKYKVTLGFGYATSQKFMVDMTGGSNGGQMKFSFDDQSVTATPYTTVPSNTLGNYTYVLFDELEFSSTSTHSFKIVVMDPAASTNSNFRIYIDYLLFEPIND